MATGRSFGVILAAAAMLMAAACGHLETRDAVLVSRVQPTYPEHARERAVEGRVVLEFAINEDGIPAGIIVVEATPEGVFESAAIAALSKWRYQPAVRYGKRVAVPENEIVMEFSLEAG